MSTQETKNIQSLVENRLKQYEAHGDSLVSEYSDFINKINENRKAHNEGPLDAHQARNVSICLENAVMEASLGMSGTQLFETVPGTASSNIAFLGVQLPIISAILPSLVLNEIATVQA